MASRVDDGVDLGAATPTGAAAGAPASVSGIAAPAGSAPASSGGAPAAATENAAPAAGAPAAGASWRVVFRGFGSLSYGAAGGLFVSQAVILAPVTRADLQLPAEAAPACYGDVLACVERRCAEHKVGCIFGDTRFAHAGRVLGEQLALAAPLPLDAGADLEWVHVSLVGRHRAVGDAYAAWKTRSVWPPAVNYYDVEPITLARIGETATLASDHACAHCARAEGTYLADHDNALANLVVLAYGPTTAERVVYNRFTIARVLAERADAARRLAAAHAADAAQLEPLLDPLLRRPIAAPEALVRAILARHLATRGAAAHDAPLLVLDV